MADQVIVVPTPINPVQIKGAIAYSAEHARIWAEGTDEQVEELGGEHSAKGWAESTGEEGREYTDQKVAEAKQEMTDEINRQSLLTLSQAESYADASVSAEAGLRVAADANLQSQIDGLAAASDVKDIVGTYAELQSYDTSTLGDNDIIKVLDDSTHGDAPSYYRWDKETETFSYIGSESASYTKAQADAKFLSQTDAASTYVSNSALTTALATKANVADGTTIVDSGSAISTVAVKEQRASAAIKQWVGTKAQYTALGSKDSNTIYVITDETDVEAITVDSEMSATSEHPVQNKVIYAAIADIINQIPAGGGAPTLTWYTNVTGTTVTIPDTSAATLVKIYKNGLLLQPTEDYTISGTTLTLVTALVATDKITTEVF